MARRKRSIAIFTFGGVFGGFSDEQKEAISEIFGCSIEPDFFVHLEEQLDHWLINFGRRTESAYGASERKKAIGLASCVADMEKRLSDLGALGATALEHNCFHEDVDLQSWLRVLARIKRIDIYLDRLAEGEINLAAIQIHCIRDLLRDYGLDSSVAHAIQSKTYKPNPMLRLIDYLWKADSRLQVYYPLSFDYWPNLAQWVSARLREDGRWESNFSAIRAGQLK